MLGLAGIGGGQVLDHSQVKERELARVTAVLVDKSTG